MLRDNRVGLIEPKRTALVLSRCTLNRTRTSDVRPQCLENPRNASSPFHAEPGQADKLRGSKFIRGLLRRMPRRHQQLRKSKRGQLQKSKWGRVLPKDVVANGLFTVLAGVGGAVARISRLQSRPILRCEGRSVSLSTSTFFLQFVTDLGKLNISLANNATGRPHKLRHPYEWGHSIGARPIVG